MNCTNRRINNKGFSLVELIIVIAIMAILATALAPQLMKYIEKSRVSTDKSNCAAIENVIKVALSNEEAHDGVSAVSDSGEGSKICMKIYGKKIQYTMWTVAGEMNANGSKVGKTKLRNAMNEAMGGTNSYPEVKSTKSKNKWFVVQIIFNENYEVQNILVDTDYGATGDLDEMTPNPFTWG